MTWLVWLDFSSQWKNKFGQSPQRCCSSCFRCCHTINEVRKIPIVAEMKRKSIECIYCWGWKFCIRSSINRGCNWAPWDQPIRVSPPHFKYLESYLFSCVSLFYVLRVYIDQKTTVRYFGCIWNLDLSRVWPTFVSQSYFLSEIFDCRLCPWI